MSAAELSSNNICVMPLNAGARLGPYEIVTAIGAGGMGEVYKGTDTRLNRAVAIKILPAALAADPAFRDRFEREARTVASLTHPHICTLFDVGRHAEIEYIVMEYLEGETLAERLGRTAGSRDPALPLGEALRIAIQVADALDKAHRSGIVHRDLKPGNVFLVRGGSSDPPLAKLLDFGLAKIGVSPVAGAGLSVLPTTPANLTAQGTILGTFQYMAPEQLEGTEADARTDIFAFGALLFEMVTGRKAFEGKSHASLLSSIMSTQPPPVSTLQRLSPAALDNLVTRCLAKDPEDRWQSARDVKRQLEWVEASGPASAAAPVTSQKRSSLRVAWAVALCSLLVSIALAATLLMPRATSTPGELSQFVMLPPEKATFSRDVDAHAISPDGRHLVFAAVGADGASLLWIRPLDALTARALAGTDEGFLPFWSPDNQSIGFFARGKLKKVDVAGGTVQTLADAPWPMGGTWNRDGDIVFGPNIGSALLRRPAGGGLPTPVTRINQSKRGLHSTPSFLPDGRHFLFTGSPAPGEGNTYVGSLDSADVKEVLRGSAVYSAQGYLLFRRDSTLMAQPFDTTRLSISGDAVPVAEGVGSTFQAGFRTSATGTLVYRSNLTLLTQLVWVDRGGRSIGVVTPPGDYQNVALSRDDTRLAFDRAGPAGMDVWMMDLQRRVTSRFTFQPPLNNVPLWSSDGRTVAFASMRNGGLDLYQHPSNAGGADELLLSLNAQPIVFPSDWSSDGRFLTYYRTDPTTQLDIWVLPLTGERKPFPLLRAGFNESQPQFSPDGRWIAYVSDESGFQQIYVQSFPTLAGKWQVSTSGGTQPRWRRDGKELLYLAPDRKLMTVAVRSGGTFNAEAPRVLFQTALDVSDYSHTYSVSADGQRFLLNTPLESQSAPMTIVLNWPALLKK